MSPSRDGIHGPVSRVSAVASESHTCAISSMTPTTICAAATKVWSLLLIQPQMIQPTLFGAFPTGLDLLAPCLPSSLLTCAYPAVGPLLASAHHHQPLPSQITEPHIHQQTHKSDKSHTQQTHIDAVSATTAHPTNPIPAPNPLLEGISSPASVPSQNKGCLGE